MVVSTISVILTNITVQIAQKRFMRRNRLFVRVVAVQVNGQQQTHREPIPQIIVLHNGAPATVLAVLVIFLKQRVPQLV